jgi:hypothetical protein
MFLRTERHGAAAARNAGIARASGDLVAFLDADDAWYPDKLRVQTSVFARWPTIVAACSDFGLVNHDGTARKDKYVKDKYRLFKAYGLDWPDIFPERDEVRPGAEAVGVFHGDAFRALFLGNFVNTSSMVVKKRVLEEAGGFSPGRRTQEDYELWLKVALRGPMAFVDRPLLYFRQRPFQLTSDDQRLGIASDTAAVVTEMAEAARTRVGVALADERVADVQCALAVAHLGVNQRRAARQALARAAKHGGGRRRVAFLWSWSWLPALVAEPVRLLYRWMRPGTRSSGGLA